jgi:uncharacterized protein YutE (UPF0331/DUF86 family)
MNEVILNKKVSIERCIAQIGKYFVAPSALPFVEDHYKQDAIAMNLQRACELSIDIANHLIRTNKLGLPQDSRDSFELLNRAGLINAELTAALKAMIGFRNVLVHEYQKLDLDIMRNIIECRLHDLVDFAGIALESANKS